MLEKKLIAVMAAAVIGTAMFGGSGIAFAHEGHDHDGATGHAVGAEAQKREELCPVSSEKIDRKANFTYKYKGKVYHLCCASCLADFKKDPEKYLGKTKGAAARVEDHDHGHE